MRIFQGAQRVVFANGTINSLRAASVQALANVSKYGIAIIWLKKIFENFYLSQPMMQSLKLDPTRTYLDLVNSSS